MSSDKQCIVSSSKGFPTHLWNSFTTDWCCWKMFLYFVPLDNHFWGRGINTIKYHMKTKGQLSKVLDLHDHLWFHELLPGQSDPMNANYSLSPVSGLSTETVPTRLAEDIRSMVHINDCVNTFCCIQSYFFLIAQKQTAFTFTTIPIYF